MPSNSPAVDRAISGGFTWHRAHTAPFYGGRRRGTACFADASQSDTMSETDQSPDAPSPAAPPTAPPAASSSPSSPPGGAAAIEAALATMPASPGVYRMLDAKGEALYVGKARSLKKRVAAYTQPARLPERLRRMVALTAAMEVITTHTEAEALLLEANLIKRLKPRYNIVLRDDKSYPWLMLTEDHPFPQIAKHRGAQTRKGSYWGPFASAWAVNQTVTAMQRVFLLRSCADTVFAARTRPCLLYQIRRCSAPCVGRIDQAEYAKLVAQAKAFLAGKSAIVQQELAAEMEAAAATLEFERAAAIRDRIRGLTHVQGSDVVNPASLADADVIAAWSAAGQTCVQVFFVRGGRNNGNRAFFPATRAGRGDAGGAGRLHRPVLRRQAAAAAAAGQPRAARAGAGGRGADLKADPEGPPPEGPTPEGGPQGRNPGAAARRKARRGGPRRD